MVKKRNTNVKRMLFLLLITGILLCNNYIFAADNEIDIAKFSGIYTVKSGDNIFSIAIANNLSIDDIVTANSLKNPNLIYSGQKLYIPLDKTNYLGKGFAFIDISIENYISVSDLDNYDYKFIHDNLAVGNWRLIGTANSIEKFYTNFQTEKEFLDKNSLNIRFAEYGDIKNGGDYAWTKGFFITYFTDIKKDFKYIIKRINGFIYMFLEYTTENRILQNLNFAHNPKYVVFRRFDEIYTVYPGDTLVKIAAGYNTTVQELVKLNNIGNEDIIYVSQKIWIPN